MSKGPLVSVITTVRNAEKYIGTAVNSILSQTYGNLEYIIVDDGSDDATGRILSSFETDRRVRLIRFSANIGRVASLNKALDSVRGKYTALHDADDISMPERIARQVDFMESNSDHVISGTNIIEIDSRSAETARTTKPELNDDLQFIMMFKCTLSNPSTMFRSDVVANKGIRYEDRFIHAEDFGFISRLIKYGKAHNIQEYLLKYRRHGDNNSKVNFRQLDASSIEIAKQNLAVLGIDLDSETVRRLRSLLSSKGISSGHIAGDISILLNIIELFISRHKPSSKLVILKLLDRMPVWLGRKNILLRPGSRAVNSRIRKLRKVLADEAAK